MLREGTQLAQGRYRLVRSLGSGSLGEVYLADDLHMRRRVAIKIITAEATTCVEASAASQARRYIERELKAIARLDHPHILDLYDYGEEPWQRLLLLYMVMPYRPEGSLAGWLRLRSQFGPLSPQEVCDLISQAADALQHAHDHQIIHRNVKPSNLLIQLHPRQPRRLHLLLSDFSIARIAEASLTTGQIIRGTPTYMAPEQWEGQPTCATDQYALAIMAYEMLVGQPPFQGGPGPLMFQHLQKAPPLPSSQNPALSPAIDRVLLQALAKRPEERFGSVAAFAKALEQAATGNALLLPDSEEAANKPGGWLEESGLIEVRLAISRSEARDGTRRRLNVAGEEVEVEIGPGVVDGQTLRVAGWQRQGAGSPLSAEEALPDLLLKLDVVPDELLAGAAASSSGARPAPTPVTVAAGAPLSSGAFEVPQLPFPPPSPLLQSELWGAWPGRSEPGQGTALSGTFPTLTCPTPTPTFSSTPPRSLSGRAGATGEYRASFEALKTAAAASPMAVPSARSQSTTELRQLARPPRRSAAQVVTVLLVLALLFVSSGLLAYFLVTSQPAALLRGGGQSDRSGQSVATARAAEGPGEEGQAETRVSAATPTSALQEASATARAQQEATATVQSQQRAQVQATAAAQAQARAQLAATATAQAAQPLLLADKTSLQAHPGASSSDCVYTLPAVDNSGYPGWSCTLVLSSRGVAQQNLAWSTSIAGPGGNSSLWPVPSNEGGRSDIYLLPASGQIRPQGMQQVRVIVRDFSQGTGCPSSYLLRFSGPANYVDVLWGCS
ncbi:protein kinase domain-containing protein [Thermogemmatispora onikobensis]|uniref:protein kinase domain-containing protein n=1 Tax=Thermogemmatispora onikobensis TaxID=732234 RepID=UPI00085305F5|nr:protein kinase [Thermogemmatispora onikobensis]